MDKRLATFGCLAVLAAVAVMGSAMTVKPAQAQNASVSRQTAAQVERDRQAIRAMAGNYDITFDYRETVSFVDGYKPLEPKLSHGFEAVRVIEDTPQRIILQHILVVDDGAGNPMVVKHWRQDWVYEPKELLTYTKSGRWTLTPVPASQRAGAWSQTVWQTDDSPRYSGVGVWQYDNGVTRWQGAAAPRPLARRDAIRKPVYNAYMAVNRHALTPTGWVHEQDNAKVGYKDGKPITYVHEVVLNTYNRSTASSKAADDYWAATKDYWATVRADWDAVIARDKGVDVVEEADSGSVTGPELMGLADDIAEGKTTSAKAVAEAKDIIFNKRS